MKVLVVGGGGREHALVWKIAQSPKVTKIYCAPGNAGIAGSATCVNISADDIDGLKKFAVDNGNRPHRGRPGAAPHPGHSRQF